MAYALCLTVLLATGGLLSLRLSQYQIEPAHALQTPPEDFSHLSQQAPAIVGLPARIKIPKLNIDASVDSVGLTSSGDLDVPSKLMNTAWYNKGPRPGEIGSAVIDGHFGGKYGRQAVFDNLHKIQKGDLIQVEDVKGFITTFTVRNLQQFGINEVVPEVFKSNDTLSHLNLITCTGIWNKTQKTFSKRLVVFADKTVL